MNNLKPIHKFNGGKGATLCYSCRVIITESLTEDAYCNKCRKILDDGLKSVFKKIEENIDVFKRLKEK